MKHYTICKLTALLLATLTSISLLAACTAAPADSETGADTSATTCTVTEADTAAETSADTAAATTTDSVAVTVPETTPETVPETQDTRTTYTVTVVDQNGNPVMGARVQMCRDELCMRPVSTDESGVATFKENPDTYQAKLLDLPAGYTGDTTTYHPFENATTLTITVTKAA